MKKTLAAIMVGMSTVCALNAAIVKNPDANTLWKEDGEMKFSAKAYSGAWDDTRAAYTPEKDGFVMAPKSGDKAYGGIAAEVNKDYPYLEFDLEPVEKKKGYYFLVNVTNVGPWYNLGDAAKAGHYVINVFENTNPKKMPKTKGFMHFQFRVYNGKVRIKNLRMVKKPSVALEIKGDSIAQNKTFTVGSKINFTITDDKTAKDPVKLTLINVSTGKNYQLGDSPVIELKQADGKFSGEVEVKKSIYWNPVGGGSILVEIQGFGNPVYTWMIYDWAPARKAK